MALDTPVLIRRLSSDIGSVFFFGLGELSPNGSRCSLYQYIPESSQVVRIGPVASTLELLYADASTQQFVGCDDDGIFCYRFDGEIEWKIQCERGGIQMDKQAAEGFLHNSYGYFRLDCRKGTLTETVTKWGDLTVAEGGGAVIYDRANDDEGETGHWIIARDHDLTPVCTVPKSGPKSIVCDFAATRSHWFLCDKGALRCFDWNGIEKWRLNQEGDSDLFNVVGISNDQVTAWWFEAQAHKFVRLIRIDVKTGAIVSTRSYSNHPWAHEVGYDLMIWDNLEVRRLSTFELVTKLEFRDAL